MKKFIQTIILILAAFSIAGCTAETAPPPTNTLPPSTQSPTFTSTATQTPLPTFTLTPTFTPSPTPIPEVTFAVIGDFGTAGPGLEAVAAMIDSWEVDFIITVGDNNYPIGSPKTIDENIGQYFHQYIYPYQGEYGQGAESNRFFPALGNHDLLWETGQPYYDYFELPGNERYYQFTWNFIDFFVLNSDWVEPDGIGKTSPQAEWLQNALAQSQAPWQVVYFHHAPYSSGYHGSTPHMRWPFKEWGADVVLSGHDHDYERLEVDGLLYLVQGLSGGQRYPVYEPIPESKALFGGTYGAMHVLATPFEMTFEFSTIEGDLIDSYTLTHPTN